jgi:parallel beta-helix repeat protein
MKNIVKFLTVLALFATFSYTPLRAEAKLEKALSDDDTTSTDQVIVSQDCFTVKGNVTGEYYPEDGSDSPVTTGLATEDMQVTNLEGDNFLFDTNNDGSFSNRYCIRFTQQWYQKIPSFENQWVEVAYYKNQIEKFTAVNSVSYPFIPTGTYQENHNWLQDHGDDISDSDMRALMNAYYHANEAHDRFSSSPLNYDGVNTQVKVHVGANTRTHFDDSDGNYIYIDAVSDFNGKDEALASDVIYHEYTHFVINQIYGSGGIESGGKAEALEEGLGDYFAATFTNDPHIFEYVGTILGAYRNINNSLEYDGSKGQYWNGQVIGGALWDVREAIGADHTDRLVLEAMQKQPRPKDFSELGSNMLLVDQDIHGGTHEDEIRAAFSSHNITIAPLDGVIGGVSKTVKIPQEAQTVPEGATATIKSGTTVRIKDNANLIINGTLTIEEGVTFQLGNESQVKVYGQVDANGAVGNRIHFERRYSDKSWRRIKLFSGGNEFDYVTINDGELNMVVQGPNNTFNHVTSKGGIHGIKAKPAASNLTLESVTLSNNKETGLKAREADVALRNSTVKDNGNYENCGSNPNDLYDYGIELHDATLNPLKSVTFENNGCDYSLDIKAFGSSSLTLPTTGITAFDGGVSIAENSTMSVQPNATAKFSGAISVDGDLTVSAGVTLTSNSSSTNWGGIGFGSGSSGTIEETVLEDLGGTGGIYINGSDDVTIDDSVIGMPNGSNTSVAVVVVDAGPRITDNTITNDNGGGVIYYNAGGTFTGNYVSASNQNDKIYGSALYTVEGSSPYFGDFGNTFKDSYYGIYADGDVYVYSSCCNNRIIGHA